MPFNGDTSNPVPSGVDTTKQNQTFYNTKNRALDVRRDTDTRKNFTITLLDIDTAIMEYLTNIVNPSVVDVGSTVKVPIIYGSPERWKAAQNDGYIRDQQGKLQLPAIMFKRNSFTPNENLATFNRYLTVPVISKFTEKNKYDRFSLLNPAIVPVNQIHAVTLPDHIKAEYGFLIWTEYVEQMNGIIEKINFAARGYWGDKQRFKFRVDIPDYTHTTEVNSDKDRMVRTEFNMSVYGYLLPDSFEDRRATVQKILTPRQINITSEVVHSSNTLNDINTDVNAMSTGNTSNPYSLLNNVISHNTDTWPIPSPNIVSTNITDASQT